MNAQPNHEKDDIDQGDRLPIYLTNINLKNPETIPQTTYTHIQFPLDPNAEEWNPVIRVDKHSADIADPGAGLPEGRQEQPERPRQSARLIAAGPVDPIALYKD